MQCLVTNILLERVKNQRDKHETFSRTERYIGATID